MDAMQPPTIGVLVILVIVAIAAASWMAALNAMELRTPGLVATTCALVVGALLIVAFPHFAARIRFERLLYVASGQLAASLTNAASDSGARENLEPAEYHAYDGWSAWHPKHQYWTSDKLWSALVPVIYLREAAGGSLAIPIDWVHFLILKRPVGIEQGKSMPFRGPGETSFVVESIRGVIGRPEWSVVRANMDGFVDE
jgi:hypothetical protein